MVEISPGILKIYGELSKSWGSFTGTTSKNENCLHAGAALGVNALLVDDIFHFFGYIRD